MDWCVVIIIAIQRGSPLSNGKFLSFRIPCLLTFGQQFNVGIFMRSQFEFCLPTKCLRITQYDGHLMQFFLSSFFVIIVCVHNKPACVEWETMSLTIFLCSVELTTVVGDRFAGSPHRAHFPAHFTNTDIWRHHSMWRLLLSKQIVVALLFWSREGEFTFRYRRQMGITCVKLFKYFASCFLSIDCNAQVFIASGCELATIHR